MIQQNKQKSGMKVCPQKIKLYFQNKKKTHYNILLAIMLDLIDNLSYEQYGNTGCGVFKWRVQN